jgi:hypothetical protein
MKKLIILFVITVACFNIAVAQNLNLGIKGGALFSSMNLRLASFVQDNSRDYTPPRPSFAIYGEGKVFKSLYVGLEIGTCSHLETMDIKYTLDNYKVSELSRFQQEQIYFTLTSQLKFGYKEWFSVGAGLGAYNNFVNRYDSGFRTVIYSPGVEFYNLEGQNFSTPNTVVGGFLNLSVNPRINKHLGGLFEVRYTMNPTSGNEISEVATAPSFNSFAIMAGLSFHL